MTLRFGIDLGGTKTEIAALDETGDLVYRHRLPTPASDYRSILSLIERLIDETETALEQQGSVGIGIPGSLNHKGMVRNANTQVLNGRYLQIDLEQQLQRPVRIANDANCFALSEATDGAGKQSPMVFGVIIGTGTGAGLVINKQLLAGVNGIAGEWGHNPLPWPNPRELLDAQTCFCGRKGCIESYLSGPGLSTQHFSRFNHRLSSEEVVTAMRKGDDNARFSFDLYCDRMARSLAHVINLLDPDMIVLGGGMSKIHELYEQIPRRWGQYIFSDVINTRIKPAQFGDSSGVRGAAWLWNEQ